MATDSSAVEFKLLDRFYIDDGELGDATPELAFVLGVQYHQFREQLLKGGAFISTILKENADRLIKLCWANKRKAVIEPCGDEFPSYVFIAVE